VLIANSEPRQDYRKRKPGLNSTHTHSLSSLPESNSGGFGAETPSANNKERMSSELFTCGIVCCYSLVPDCQPDKDPTSTAYLSPH